MKSFRTILLLIGTILIGFSTYSQVYIDQAEVVSVYDGDTFTLNIDLGYDLIIHQVSVRLDSVDTPEKGGRGVRILEKKAGKMVSNYVKDLMLGEFVQFKTVSGKEDKYGRYPGKILIHGFWLHKHLIEKQYARPYTGGNKSRWTNGELQYIINSLK